MGDNKESTLGSDHFPVSTIINYSINRQDFILKRWCFKKANWQTFKINCEETSHMVTLNDNIEDYTRQITEHILNAANSSTVYPKNNS